MERIRQDEQELQVPEYGPAVIIDYGTLTDLTEAGNVSHEDVVGTPVSAYPS
jgi:hypothetical protein